MRKKLLITFLFFISFSFLPHAVFAQTSPLTGSLSLFPEFPEPLQEVSISLESYSFDATRAFITWTINNKKVLSGYGETKLKVPGVPAGAVSTISVSAKAQEGGTYEDGLTFSPASVQILWEATDSYVPPFYKGKALVSEGASVKLVALPSFYSGGKRVPANLVSYSWTFNDNLARDSSGLGKLTYFTQLNYLENENTIKVVATSLDGIVRAEKRDSLTPNEIIPRVYFANNLTGTDYAHAAGDRTEISKETTFVFEPYFISSKSLSSPDLSFSWSLNGIPTTPQEENAITIVPKENAQGSGVLDITVENTKKYLQKAESSLSVVFDTLNTR